MKSKQITDYIHEFSKKILSFIPHTQAPVLQVDIPQIQFHERFVRIGILLPFGAPECQLYWDKNMIFHLKFFHIDEGIREKINEEYTSMLREISRYHDCFNLESKETKCKLVPYTNKAEIALDLINKIESIDIDTTFSNSSCLYIKHAKEKLVAINYIDSEIRIQF